ncbi:MAG: dihydrofolate reductase family protein, partial [Patescibacteria group bacterium]
TIRKANGRSENPIKVTVVNNGELDPKAAFFTTGSAQRFVYTTDASQGYLQKKVGHLAEVIAIGKELTMDNILADLYDRHVMRLMVEGGSGILTQFLSAGLADELQLATASFFVGGSKGPRFVGDGHFRWDKNNRMKLQEVKAMGDVVAASYISPELEEADRRWMDLAFELSGDCVPIETAYCVGAVIVGRDGGLIATGHSRETDSTVHAEEAALIKVGAASLEGATVYSTLEPCSTRNSRSDGCAQLILRNGGIQRVVYALPEPLFI